MTVNRESRDLQNKWVSPEMVHNQVRRIKEEATLIAGEEDVHHVPSATLGVVLFSRPNLPCSPLSGKTARCAKLTCVMNRETKGVADGGRTGML